MRMVIIVGIDAANYIVALLQDPVEHCKAIPTDEHSEVSSTDEHCKASPIYEHCTIMPTDMNGMF